MDRPCQDDAKQLYKGRSRLFHSKKMKSLNKLFTNTSALQLQQPLVLHPSSAESSPSSSIVFNSPVIRQYPPKPLVYSDAISPPPDCVDDKNDLAQNVPDLNQTSNHGSGSGSGMAMPLTAASLLRQDQRRSSAPALASHRHRDNKSRIMTFFRTTLS